MSRAAAACRRPNASLAPSLAPCCGCLLHRRRALAGALLAAALPARARNAPGPIDPNVACRDYGKVSTMTRLVSADQMEEAAQAQYRQMLRQAAAQRALGPDDHPQVIRLRAIAQRIIPFTRDCNGRAAGWHWEVNLLGSRELNAFCMPGGKIACYHGLLAQLQLSDDEVAAVMGHEIAHALREHSRERMGKLMATRVGAGVLSAVLGTGSLGDAALNVGGQLLTLKFSRSDESEADIVGMELAARAGYDPRAALKLWQKMMAASQGAPPAWMSTHPSSQTRLNDIQARLPRVAPLYAAAPRPPQRYAPPAAPTTPTNH